MDEATGDIYTMDFKHFTNLNDNLMIEDDDEQQ